MSRCQNALRRLTLVAAGISMTLVSTPPQAATYDNDELRDTITAIGVIHNVAYPSALLPPPAGIVPGSTVYATNLGLKYIPPVLEAPASVAVAPNSVDGCQFVFTHPRAAQEERQDYLGLITSFPSQWGVLGKPDVFHFNTDVRVSAVLDDRQLVRGSMSVPAGRHVVTWHANTLITPVFDYPPWFLLGAFSAKDSAAKAGGSAGKQLLVEILKNVAQEGAMVTAGWLLPLGVPTPASNPIDNSDDQSLWVFDIHPPTLTSSQPLAVLEATQVGGEFLRDHLSVLRGTLTASDACGREPTISHTGPTFLPVGVDSIITWTARDDGPKDSGGGWNEVAFEQRVRIQDTRPPLLLAPPAQVLETSATSLTTNLGAPGVFDLADVNVAIVNDAPTSFARDTRTRVTWTATDASGNVANRAQWITVKAPGTNTRPLAQDQIVSAVSFTPTRIQLNAADNDLLSGRYDQLAFDLPGQPANGFFVTPLFPFFIQDHRVENVYNLSPPELAARLNQECENDSFIPPTDFVTRPRYITIGDDGATYVSDQFYLCDRSGNTAFTRSRIARFETGTDGELTLTAQLDTQGAQPRSLHFAPDGAVHYISPRSGNSEGDVVMLTPDLTITDVLPTNVVTGALPRLVRSPYSMAVDEQGVVYMTDGRVLYAFDVIGVRPNRAFRFLGAVATIAELNSAAEYKDLAIDSGGNLYMSDSSRNRVWKFGATSYTGDGPTGFTRGPIIGWMGRCSSNLTAERACDVDNQRSYGFSCTDALCGVAVSPGSGSAPGQFNLPLGIAIDPKDVLYVTDSNNARVQRFTRDGFFGGEAVSACPTKRCFVLGDFGRPVHVTANSSFFYLLDQDRDILHVYRTTPITDVEDQTLTPQQSAFVTYQSNNNFLGNDSFQFSASDGLATSAPATVSIAVSRSLRPPTADAGLSVELSEDSDGTVPLSGTDPDIWDQDVLSFAIVQQPRHGMLTGTGATRTYTPDQNFTGEDDFTFTVSDGQFTSAPEKVTLRVQPVNDVPAILIERPAVDVGTGYAFTFNAELSDPDVTDTHRLVVDFGDGTVLQQGAPGSDVTLTETARGSALLIARHAYASSGSHTLRYCVSEGSPAPALANCTGAAASRTVAVNASAMADVALSVDDSLPKSPDVAGILRSAAVRDGVPFSFNVVLTNVAPVIPFVPALPASNTRLQLEVDAGLRILGIRPSIGSCLVAGQTVECNLGQVASSRVATIVADVAGDGSFYQDATLAVAALATSDTRDPSGASIAAREVSVTVDPDGDADGDGVPNRDDAFPGNPAESADTDADGIGNNADLDDDNDTMRDVWETRHGLDPLLASDAAADMDGDGLSNVNEFALGTDPNRADTDHDAQRDDTDNCPTTFNARQFDINSNGVGDECDAGSAAAAVRIPDIDGNGAAEIAMLRTDATDRATLYVRDSVTGRSVVAAQMLDAYREVNDFEAFALTRGSAAQAVAFLATRADGTVVVDIVDLSANSRMGVHPYFDADWTPIALAPVSVLDDTDIAVLAVGPLGRIRVETRSMRTGELRNAFDAFASGWTPVSLVAVSNRDGQNTPSLAVLATHDDGRIAAELFDAGSGAQHGIIDFFNPDWSVGRMVVVPGTSSDQLAVLATHVNGHSAFELRSASTGVVAGATTVLEPGLVSLDLVLVRELAGNAAGPELAILASNAQGQLHVESRDAGTGDLIGRHGFTDINRIPRGLVANDDVTSSLGVTATDANGVLTVELRNSLTGALVNQLEAPGSEPAPAPMPPPPPPSSSGGGGGGSLGATLFVALLLALLPNRRRKGYQRANWENFGSRIISDSELSRWRCAIVPLMPRSHFLHATQQSRPGGRECNPLVRARRRRRTRQSDRAIRPATNGIHPAQVQAPLRRRLRSHSTLHLRKPPAA